MVYLIKIGGVHKSLSVRAERLFITEPRRRGFRRYYVSAGVQRHDLSEPNVAGTANGNCPSGHIGAKRDLMPLQHVGMTLLNLHDFMPCPPAVLRTGNRVFPYSYAFENHQAHSAACLRVKFYLG